jgi:hypothetical protein
VEVLCVGGLFRSPERFKNATEKEMDSDF